jgi:carbamoyl-phosphate synthase small subunit
MSLCNRGFKAKLLLEDGTIIEGCGFGAKSIKIGELVFTTAMNGYPESMTDPSYKGQILVITHPLVGNYGVPKPIIENGIIKNFESEHIQIEGLVVTEETGPSKWNSVKSLHEWMEEEGIPGISRVDTRMLVKKIRDYGVITGILASGEIIEDKNFKEFFKFRYDEIDFTEYVSPKKPIIHHNSSEKTIVVIDCGVKHGILYQIYKLGYRIVRLPCKSRTDEILEYNPVGIVYSNGPGNPKLLSDVIENFRALVEYKIPVLGICLGHQIATLAMGGKVRKMKFGHRAINKPVIDINTNKCYISTHNHGYAILDKNDIPIGSKVWFINPDDGTIEGLIYEKLPLITVQFHPEARPGPWDTTWIFQYFHKMVISNERKY